VGKKWKSIQDRYLVHNGNILAVKRVEFVTDTTVYVTKGSLV